MMKAHSHHPRAFPYAPYNWDEQMAQRVASLEHVHLGHEEIEVVQALQEYFAKHEKINFRIRELHDALEERFHGRGGMKHLYQLFPGGPVAQGCRIAGLPMPSSARDASFGSVQ